MKQFLRHIFLLVAMLVATANAWATAQYEWVQRFNGTTTFDNDDLKKITNGEYTNNVKFSISGVSYNDGLVNKWLAYSQLDRYGSATSTFSWTVKDNTNNPYSVSLSKIQCNIRGYQATAFLEAADAYFTGNSPVDYNTNGTGEGSSKIISTTTNLSGSSTTLYMSCQYRKTTFTLHNIQYTYKVTQRVPKFQYKAVAVASPNANGTVSVSWDNVNYVSSTSTATTTTTWYDGNTLSLDQGGAKKTAYFKAVPADGYLFAGWSMNGTDIISTEPNYSISDLVSYTNDDDGNVKPTITMYAIFTKEPKSLKIEYAYGETTTFYVEDQAPVTDMFQLKDVAGNNVIENAPVVSYKFEPQGIVAIENGVIKAVGAGVTKVTAWTDGNEYWGAANKEVTLTIIKYTPTFTWNASNTPYYFGTSIPNIFATSNPDCQYTIVSDNEHVAKVIDNTMHIYNVEETANITVTQEENYKWYGKTETYTITPANPNNHVTFTINSENYYNVFRYDHTGNLSWKNNGVLLGSPDVGSGATNYNDRYYDIVFTGIPDKLSFDYERSTDIATGCDWYVKESVDGVTWSEKNVWEGNSNSGSVEVQLNPTTRYLRFCYSGNYGGYFRNIKVTELEKFEADPNPLDFGTRPVGEGEQLLPLNFSHANAGRITTATIIGKDAQYFTVTPTVIPGTGRDMLGTTHLNVTFANNGEDRGPNSYEATLVITDNAGHREEVQLTGVRHGKATPEFTWNPNNFPYYFNTSIANIVVSSNTDYANCPLTITSSNGNIAKVENGRLYIYDQSGEVTFTVTQRGNDRFKEHTESFTFTPKAKPDLEVPFQVTQPIYGQAITVGDNCSWDGDDHHVKLGNGAWDDTKKTAILVFSGRPDKLTFSYATSNNVAVVEIGSFDNPKWEVEESPDGENWKSIWSVRTNSTSWAKAEIPLSETTQYVRFSYDGNYAGYFKNINISELVGYKYLRAADGHYLSRGAKWGTQAVVDAFGVVSRISRYTEDNENIYTRFFFVDNEQYMFETETADAQRLHEVFTDHGTADNTNHLWQINNNGGVLTIQSANDVGVSHRGNYITAINGVLAFTTNEAEATKWQMEDYTEHPQYIADMLNRQAAAAALKDFGEDINTLEKVRNRLKVEDFETREITIQPPLALGEQTGESRTIEGMPHIYEQTITGLDTGFYRLTVKALYRISNSEIAWKCYQEKGKESVLAYAYANDVQYPIQSVYASYHSSAIENTDDCRDGKYYSTTLSSANVAFNDANRYLNDVYVYVEADPGQTTGTLRYGIKCPSYVPGAWLAYSTITLTYFGRKEYVFVGNDSEEPTDWQRAGNWDTGTLPGEYHNVRIEADVNIDQPIEVYGISITEGKNVHITSTGGLTVGKSGVVSAATGTITIDNTPEGAGFLKVDPSTVNKPAKVTVNYTTEAYNSGNPRDEVWQYMGAPGNDMQMSDANNTMIYHWNEQQGWLKMSNTNLQPFVGYAFTQNKADSASFQIQATPIIPDKPQEITLTLTQNGMRGSNLFVNSFLAPIDLAKFDGTEFEGDVDQTFYLYNSGSWKQWQNNGGANNQMNYGVSPGQYYALSPYGASLMDQEYDQTTIPPMQGVYVIAREDGAKIYLDYAKHVYAAGASNQAMRAPERANDDFKRVRLQVNSQNSGADRMYVIQHDECTMGYDNGYDARNMAVASQVSIYTTEAEGQMEISVSDNIDSTYIGFNAGADSEYTLHMTSVVGEMLYLKDLQNQTLISVGDGVEYRFTAEPNSVNDKRFLLLDQRSNGVTTDQPEVQVYVHDKIAHIVAAPEGSDMVVYSIGGTAIANYVLGVAPCVVDLSELPVGVYVLRVNDKAFKCVCR